MALHIGRNEKFDHLRFKIDFQNVNQKKKTAKAI